MNDIIKRFQKLDLTKYPEHEIKDLISEIGVIPVMRSEYHDGKIIYRARANNNENDDFTNVSDLSFKPQKFNKTYQRASTPNKTMFYGALIPEEKGEDIIDDERIIGAFEVVDFLRKPSIEKGEQVITYGVWRVNSTISTYSVIHPKIDKLKVQWLKKIATNFYNELEKCPQFKDKTLIVQEYLAKEFSKHVCEGKDYDYMISGLFSNKVCELGVDGILYPSVKMQGTGLNIALTPECVNQKLTLEAAIKCKVYKKCKKVIVNNLKRGTVNPDGLTISWEEIPLGRYRTTEEQIRKMLAKVVCKKNSDTKQSKSKNANKLFPRKKKLRKGKGLKIANKKRKRRAKKKREKRKKR